MEDQESRSFTEETSASNRLSSRCFPQLNSLSFVETGHYSSLKISDHHGQVNHQAEGGLFSHGAPAKSPTSSCSQTSGPGSQCPTGARPHAATINALNGGNVFMTEDLAGMLNRACNEENCMH